MPINDKSEDPSQKSTPSANVICNSLSVSNKFYCTASGDASTGTFYTDMTGTFPVTSRENMKAYFVAYNYCANTIFAKPCPYLKDATIITAFEEVLIQQTEGQGLCIQI